ncbi:hypothetical protein cand_010090 [Cryptosporidium andersoni]|uniref:Uncharacterized protein n=1 Tax=Cryptosporidium andersoni TaxID=117008 RepID=A0A1J4MHA9_9CRYT|nr:hypothetical protein cand_010090 [Cryptosporidium andersoni]
MENCKKIKIRTAYSLYLVLITLIIILWDVCASKPLYSKYSKSNSELNNSKPQIIESVPIQEINPYNEEVLNDTIEELTDISNDVETKLEELKQREAIMNIDKRNIGIFASITMIALIILFYLGVAHMEDALKDTSILHGDDIGSPQSLLYDPRW